MGLSTILTVQAICVAPMKIKTTQFPGGFRLKLNSSLINYAILKAILSPLNDLLYLGLKWSLVLKSRLSEGEAQI